MKKLNFKIFVLLLGGRVGKDQLDMFRVKTKKNSLKLYYYIKRNNEKKTFYKDIS